MAEEQQTTQTESEAKDQTTAATSAETKKTDTESQELMIPKHRYDEVAKKLKALEEDAAQKAKTQAAEDEKRLTEQAEWQKLAESRKARVDELTPKAELADKLTELITAQYAAEIKSWPEQVRNMAPAEDASILAKLEWANKARALATELMADKTPAAGNGRRPTPVSAANQAKATETQAADWRERAARRYR